MREPSPPKLVHSPFNIRELTVTQRGACYTGGMAKKITLASLAAQMAKGFAVLGKRVDEMDARMEKGFGAVAADITDIKRDMATKDHVIALGTQVNSIETQLRGMKHAKLESRVADLEDKVFGATR